MRAAGRRTASSFAFGVALLLLVASQDAVEAGERVAVVCHDGEPSLLQHVVGELRFLGFEPVVVPGREPGPGGSALAQVARDAGAATALSIDARARRLGLWFAATRSSGAGGKHLASLVEGDGERELALRAAELVRARFAIPQAAEDFRAYVDYPRLSLRLAGGPTFSAGGLSAAAHLWLGLGYRPLRWLELEGLLVGPVYPAHVGAPEGTGRMFTGLIGVGPLFVLVPAWHRISLQAGAGVGLGIVKLQGTAREPLLSSSDWLFSAVGYGRLSLGVQLARRLQLRLGSILGVAVPRPVMTFADRRVASWGRPLIAVSAGLELLP